MESKSRKYQISTKSNFLTTFGYLPKDDLRSSALRTDEHLRKAIERMQKYGGLRVTGDLDNETLKLLEKRRCGNSDTDAIYSNEYDEHRHRNERRSKRYALNGEKWPTNKVTWNIKSWPQQMSQSQVTRILQSAFALWSEISKLEFVQLSSNQNDADIEIQFLSGDHGDNYPFDGSGRILAHAFSPGTGIGGDVHFDQAETWVIEQTEEDELNGRVVAQLFAVASHEIGHSLGLSHSTVFGSLMFPYYQKINLNNYKLPLDDVEGIQLLYGSKENTRWTPVNIPISTTPTPRLPSSSNGTIPNGRNTQNSSFPDICSTEFDAIANIRNEIFFFKGKYFWRLIETNKLERIYPVEIKQFFKFPRNFEKVDAVYERPLSKKIVFFIGELYYEFTGNRVDSAYPKNIKQLGFPEDVKKVNAALVWRFDEEEEKVEVDNPRSMSVWRGIPSDLDTAFKLINADGLTYFTRGQRLYKFKNTKMKLLEPPTLIAQNLFSHYCR